MISTPCNNRIDGGDDLVAVVGAGAAGMAAAVSAARAGARVVLVERHQRVGGTVAHALLHTLGGIFDDQGNTLNEGLVVELTERLSRACAEVKPRQIGKTWTLSVCPDTYAEVVTSWLENEPRLTVLTETTVEAAEVNDGRLKSLEVSGPAGSRRLAIREAIDTSGSAALVRKVNPELAYDDPLGASGGLVVRIRGMEPGALEFPKNIKFKRGLSKGAAEGTLPEECASTWLDQGVYADEVYAKLSVPLNPVGLKSGKRDEVMRRMEGVVSKLTEFLFRYDEFSRAKLDRVGELGVRDGGRIKGDYCLTEKDVREGRTFDDGVCRCCWPIEYWHPEKGVSLEYLPEGSYYEIPLRSLKIKETENLWAAGKSLSADCLAQASARVVGSCWSMGEAVGQAAAERCLVATG